MEIFSDREGWALLFRWAHILAGITWIGLLYYFNFVQVPFFAEIEPEFRATAIRKLVPRALWWFRYAALVTWLAGVSIMIVRVTQGAFDSLQTYSVTIISGMALGTIMFLNVWGVIWPNQKIVIGSADSVAAGGAADPRAADAARRALLASRTNVVFSAAMVFFMATASHLALFDGASVGGIWAYFIVGAAIVGALEANALVGLTGEAKKPLEKVNTTIGAAVLLLVVLYTLLQVLTL